MRLILFLLITCASIACGQVSTASIFGRVEDASGGVVRGVMITARQESTGFVRSTVADAAGSYRMDQISPGVYSIQAQHEGFKTAFVSHVTIEVNQQAQLDIRLSVGDVHDSIDVNAVVSPLQTADETVSFRVSSRSLMELPLDERDVTSLVTLGPGAVPRQLGGFVHDADNDEQQGSRGSVAFNPAINGTRPSMNAMFVDGAYDSDRNTFAPAVLPPMDSVQEFRALTSLAPGGSIPAAGGQVDIVTKSGSSELHGSAFEFFRNEATDARNYFDDPALERPIFRRNQFGGTLGGPLLLRSFFFVAYEGLRGKSATPSVQLVPDATLRTGDFTGGAPIYDPLSTPSAANRALFAGNVIPAERIDPIARNYLTQFEPLPNRSPNGLGNYLDTTPSTSNHDTVTGRIDHQFRRGGLVFGRYTINDDRGGIGGSFPLLPTSERLRAQQFVLGDTVAGSSCSNEVRAYFTRLRLFDVPHSSTGGQNTAAEIGLPNPPTDPFAFGLPYFFLSDFSTVTDDPTLPQIQRDNTWGLSETFSRIRGKRTYRFGVNWAHFQFNYRQSNAIRGEYLYGGGFTGNGDPATGDALGDFLLGYPVSTMRTEGDSQAYLRQDNLGAFIQQDWQITNRLSLSLGLQYDYFSPFTDAFGKLQNIDYAASPEPRLERVQQSSNPNYLNFAPRAGLAWRLPRFFSGGGDTVFRAGYGVYFNPEIAIEGYDLVLNGIRTELNSTDPSGPPVLTTRDGFPTNSGAGFPSYYGVDQSLPTPYVQQWSAGFQRELPGSIVAEASYVGNKGTDLGRFRRFNTALHTETGENLDPRPGDLQSLRTYPDLGTLFQFEHIANSSYHSLQLRAEKRFRKSLSFLASFVWSKAIDDSSATIPSLFDSGGAQDERNLHLERALSAYNVGRRLSAGFFYALPGSSRLGPLLRGWQFSGVITIQDGTPLDPLYLSSDTANAGTFTRPDVVPGQSISLPSDQRSPDHWFNTAAFAAPAPYHFGNAARDVIPGPGNEVVDLAIHKRFTLSDRAGLEFRAESFNVLNNPNLGFPDPYPDQGPFFGKILIAGQPRRIQFGLRLEF